MSLKADEDKLYQVADNKLLGLSGPVADRSSFSEYVEKNIRLDAMRRGTRQSSWATANWISEQLAYALRKGPYQVQSLFCGFDEPTNEIDVGDSAVGGPQLYWMDYMGSMRRSYFGAQGHCNFFLWALFDANWKPNMTLDEALDLVEICKTQLKTRFLVNAPSYVVKVIDKDGIRVVEQKTGTAPTA
jgi:20S proteasome alpha/beta subunit